MDEKFRNLPLRSGVGIVILNKENKIFVAKRIDNPKNFWQMPQGGVDKDEDFLSAAYRELEEETSIKEVELINMGILKEFRGLKLGSMLLNHAIASASRKNPNRMWVHTCSLDHKHALQNYRSKGFEIFKEEEIDFVA